ncbi:MAG TPA: hypothetical protein VGV06_05475, partial [Methylomirabilota bacterium]|nr:hypothetical protein [Methylomirabilota bacterium]
DKSWKPMRPAPSNTERPVAKAGDKSGIAIDFDGTCTINADGSENPKMRKLVEALVEKGVSVSIFTARPVDEVENWLLEHGWPDLPVTNEKSPDFKVMLDDRGVQFDPKMLYDIPALTAQLSNFKTWWEKSEGPRVPAVSRTVDMVEDGRVVVRHTFYGDDLTEARGMERAHRKADASLDAALAGRDYKDVAIDAVRKVGWTDEARAAAAEARRAKLDPAGIATVRPEPEKADKYKARMRDASGELFIHPNGQVYCDTGEQASSGDSHYKAGHAQLANALGHSTDSAIDAGFVRGRADNGLLSMEFDHANPKARENAAALVSAHGKGGTIHIDQRAIRAVARSPATAGRHLATPRKTVTEAGVASSARGT